MPIKTKVTFWNPNPVAFLQSGDVLNSFKFTSCIYDTGRITRTFHQSGNVCNSFSFTSCIFDAGRICFTILWQCYGFTDRFASQHLIFAATVTRDVTQRLPTLPQQRSCVTS